jgi:hypothetical protein
LSGLKVGDEKVGKLGVVVESGGGEEEEEELGRPGSYILVTFRSSAVSFSHICEFLLKPRLCTYFLTVNSIGLCETEDSV